MVIYIYLYLCVHLFIAIVEFLMSGQERPDIEVNVPNEGTLYIRNLTVETVMRR